MKVKNKNLELNETNYNLLFKTFLFGLALAEVVLIIEVFFLNFRNNSTQNDREIWFWIIVTLYIIIIGYRLFSKKFWTRTSIILKSYRFDLLIIFAAGTISMLLIGGIGIDFFRKLVASMSWLNMIVFFLLPIVFFLATVLRKLQIKLMKNNDIDSSFMSDKEGQGKNDDAFEFLEPAKRFAERVYNQGSSESLVFGIDAPWGTGKSTFINICKEYWNEKYDGQIIVYTFDPLRFENNDNILDKFVDGLMKTIKINVFAPELESLIAKYVKLLNDSKLTFSIFGFRFGLPFDKSSIDKTFQRLDMVLRSMDKKIVIVLDDLDRLNFSSIKEILFVIKKSFILPNISYVLCYDTENITALEHQRLDTEKIIEFLEKFINIKTSLYLDHNLLLNFFTEYKDQSLARNLLSNPELVSKAVEGLKDIFRSNEYHSYIPFIGNARKLKRLINTIILLEVEQLDFSNSDFDKHDLIHLLIIYINYPNVFRKIYNTEAQGKRGYFSVVRKYDVGYPEGDKDDAAKNSTKYTEYIKSLTDSQKFILDKVFNASQRLSRNISQEQYTSYACFNGAHGGRNLEQYLNLIIKVSRPVITNQYKFYVNLKEEILKETSITEVLKREEFSFTRGESNHEQLWRVLINSPHNEYSPQKANEIIQQALNFIPQYSILKIKNIGVGLRRDTLIYFIVNLLDKVGWTDEGGKSWNNTDENILSIADWIFGENQHKKNGILQHLANKERGILGLHDLLLFRLYCCSGRDGDMYNLSRALSRHGEPNSPTSGELREIIIREMRKVSQFIFAIFKNQFIDLKKNIFDEVFGLSAESICGDSYDYIKSNLSEDELSNKLTMLKSELLNFITYQLGSTIESNSIPCGYYDIEGNQDNHSIKESINEYLFETCFNPKEHEKGYDYFLYYLLINHQNKHPFGVHKLKIENLTNVLDKDRIKAYWRIHRESIQAKDSFIEDNKFFIGDYENLTANHLDEIFKVLNELILVRELDNESN